MRFGLVGTGPWGRKLTEALTCQGAELVAHSRLRKIEEDWLGRSMPMAWQDLVEKSGVDAVVVAATPAITMKAAETAWRMGIPVLATKPLGTQHHDADVLLHMASNLRSAFFVDYSDLWSPCYRALAKVCAAEHMGRRGNFAHADVFVHGPGPERAFHPLLDYGPHAVAMVLSLFGLRNVISVKHSASDGLMTKFSGSVQSKVNFAMTIVAGRSEIRKRRLKISAPKCQLVYEEVAKNENGKRIAYASRNGRMVKEDAAHDPLAVMAYEFIRAAGNGTGDPSYLELSASVATILTSALAKAVPPEPWWA